MSTGEACINLVISRPYDVIYIWILLCAMCNVLYITIGYFFLADNLLIRYESGSNTPIFC